MDITVQYNGRYPNRCSNGTLVVTIDGTVWIFPEDALSSGGRVWFDEEWNEHVESGPWKVVKWPKDFPKRKGVRRAVVDAINEQIPWGCCGGCV